MEKEKVIDLTTDELQMIRTFCQKTLVLETPNTSLVNSILGKITSVQSESSEKESQSNTTSENKESNQMKTIKTKTIDIINTKTNTFLHFMKKLLTSVRQ